ncbi:MAG: hypothetical protein MJA29_08135 [Candidatus Omnitrophica bacterium]|nr:hypothetical protein [Candidatus Omnitrophota bacterium]
MSNGIHPFHPRRLLSFTDTRSIAIPTPVTLFNPALWSAPDSNAIDLGLLDFLPRLLWRGSRTQKLCLPVQTYHRALNSAKS